MAFIEIVALRKALLRTRTRLRFLTGLPLWEQDDALIRRAKEDYESVRKRAKTFLERRAKARAESHGRIPTESEIKEELKQLEKLIP